MLGVASLLSKTLILPSTSSFASGVVSFIPTLPSGSTRNFSVKLPPPEAPDPLAV